MRNAMDETGVDFAMDVHGDEAIPVSFLAGYEGIPGWTEEQGNRYYRYEAILDRRTPDFQTEQGYTKAAPGKANLSMSTNQVAERFAQDAQLRKADKMGAKMVGYDPTRGEWTLEVPCF